MSHHLMDTGTMTRRITETFHGYSVREVIIDIEGTKHHGEVRAQAIDDDPRTNQGHDLWALVHCGRLRGSNSLRWLPESQIVTSDVQNANAARLRQHRW